GGPAPHRLRGHRRAERTGASRRKPWLSPCPPIRPVATSRSGGHLSAMTEPAMPPLKAVIIPVTPLQQNCTLLWCTKTMKGAFVDAGGDLAKLRKVAADQGVTIEKLLATHGHIDHCGGTGILAEELGVPIEGPQEEDRFWIA